MGWDQASCRGVCCQGSIRGGQGLPGNDNQMVWLLTLLGEDIKKLEEGGKKSLANKKFPYQRKFLLLNQTFFQRLFLTFETKKIMKSETSHLG